jgi:phage terminase Nu1 subunit (DNA packaging protein)
VRQKSGSEDASGDAGLIPAEVAARLIMVEEREFDRLVRAGWITAETRNPVRFRLVAVVQGHLKYLEHERTRGRTVAEIAQHLGLSVKRVNELIDRGIIERQSRGDYDIDDCRLAYLKNLSATAAGRGAGEGEATLAAQRARLIAAKADLAEIERQKAIGGWAPIEMMSKAFRGSISVMRELILAAPGTLAWHCEGKTREEIFDLLDEYLRNLLNELADPTTYAKAKEKFMNKVNDKQPETAADD